MGHRCTEVSQFLEGAYTFNGLLGKEFRKLEKAVAVSGVCSGVLEENSRKVPGKLLENFSRIAKCCKFQDFGHRERQTCRELWAHTADNLVPAFRAGCFLKSTVPAFSSFSEE